MSPGAAPPPRAAFPHYPRAPSFDGGSSVCNTELSAGGSERSWGAPAGRSSLGGVSPVGGSVVVYGVHSADANAGLSGEDMFSPARPSQLARADARDARQPPPLPPLLRALADDNVSSVSSAAGLSEIGDGGARHARETKRLTQFGRLVAAGAAAEAAAAAAAASAAVAGAASDGAAPLQRAGSPAQDGSAGGGGDFSPSLRRRRAAGAEAGEEEAPPGSSPPAPRRRAASAATADGASSVSAGCGEVAAALPPPPAPAFDTPPLLPPSPLFGVRDGPRAAEPYRPSLSLNEDVFDFALVVRAPAPVSGRARSAGASGGRGCDSDGGPPPLPADDYDDEAEDDVTDGGAGGGGGGEGSWLAAPAPTHAHAPPPTAFSVLPCATILAALRAAGLTALRVRSLSRRTWLLKVRAPDWRLELEAEKLRLRMRRTDGGWSKFRRALRGAFAGACAGGADGGGGLFHSSDRQMLIDHIVRCPAREGGAALERGTALGDLVVAMFPLHMRARLEELRSDLLAPWRPQRSAGEWDRVGAVKEEWYAPATLVDVEEGGGAGSAPPPPPPPPPVPSPAPSGARCCTGSGKAAAPPSACRRALRGAFPVRALYTAFLLLSRWARCTRRLCGCCCGGALPLDRVAAYYGETIAFYFSFTQAYTAWLVAPAVGGALMFVGQLWYGAVVTAYSPAYALLSALWSLAFLEWWRRRSVEQAQRWGTLGQEEEEAVRPGFVGTWKRDAATGEVLRVFPAWRRAAAYAVTVPVTAAVAGALLSGLVLVFSARDHVLAALSRAAGIAALRGAVAGSPAVAAAVAAGTLPPPPPLPAVDLGASLSVAWRAGLGGFLTSPPREWLPSNEAAPALLAALAEASGAPLPLLHVGDSTAAFAPLAPPPGGGALGASPALQWARVETYFSSRGDVRWWAAMTVPPAVLGLLLPALDAAFDALSLRLVALENHATESSARASRIAKVFTVRFVGAFASLFWYAFSPSASPTQLAVQLAAYLVVGQVFGAALRLVLPACAAGCAARAHAARLRAAEDSGLTEGRRGARLLRHARADAWREARLPVHDPFADYCALVTQW